MEKERRQVDIDRAKEKVYYDNNKFTPIQVRSYHKNKLRARARWTSNYNIVKLVVGAIVLIAFAVFVMTMSD